MADAKMASGQSSLAAKWRDEGTVVVHVVPANTASGGEIKLEKTMTLFGGITMTVGIIIGFGIFVSSIGSVGILLVVCALEGIFSMFGVFCYAELGTMIVKSGGDCAYILDAFGPFLAFMLMWVECIVIKPCLTAVQGLTFGFFFLASVVPDCGKEPMLPVCEYSRDVSRYLAAASIAVAVSLTVAKIIGVRSARYQDTITKKLAIYTFVIELAQGNRTKQDEMNPALVMISYEEINVGTVTFSIYSGLMASLGWMYLNQLIEEFQNPKRNLPIATWVSCIVCTVLYTLTNIAYCTTVTPQEMPDSPAVAIIVAQRLYGASWWILPVVCPMLTGGASALEGMNGNLLTALTRFFVGARQGHLPNIVSGIQTKYVTPMPAVVPMGILACVYLYTMDIHILIHFVGFVTWIVVGLSFVALLYFRWKFPDTGRPLEISLWWPWPVAYLALTVFIVSGPTMASPTETGIGMLIILTGIPVYFVFVAWKNKPEAFQSFCARASIVLQKLFILLPNDNMAAEDF